MSDDAQRVQGITASAGGSARETARRLEAALARARAMLADLEQVGLMGWYDGGAAGSAFAARDRAVEMVAHLERALEAQRAHVARQREVAPELVAGIVEQINGPTLTTDQARAAEAARRAFKEVPPEPSGGGQDPDMGDVDAMEKVV